MAIPSRALTYSLTLISILLCWDSIFSLAALRLSPLMPTTCPRRPLFRNLFHGGSFACSTVAKWFWSATLLAFRLVIPVVRYYKYICGTMIAPPYKIVGVQCLDVTLRIITTPILNTTAEKLVKKLLVHLGGDAYVQEPICVFA